MEKVKVKKVFKYGTGAVIPENSIHPSATKEENTRKCPSCKSLNFYDKDGFLFECEDCGHIWNEDDEPSATHGKEGDV